MRIQLIAGQLLLTAFAFAQTPKIFDGGIVNGADFQKGKAIATGSLITIFGTQLASKTAQADSIPLSTSLGGVTVTFVNGDKSVSAPLTFVGPDDPANQQINAQVPWDLVPANTSATVSVVVTKDGVASAPATVNVAPFSPGIFASNGRAIAVNGDGTLAWPSNLFPGLITHPAKVGDVIIVYATGLGAIDVPVASGQNSLDQLRSTLTKPQVTIGGLSADVLFSGLSPQFVGVNQLNIKVPDAPGDAVQMQLQIGGITTPTGLTIAVTR